MTNLKDLTILFVEDENEMRRETAAFLELYCRRVHQVANGRDALALFDKEKPDLVISDIRMPFMDGIELATHLRKSSPDTPIIFCTAFSEIDYLLKAIELQVAAFVCKPVDVDELIAAITRAATPVLLRREIGSLSDEMTSMVDSQVGRHPLQQAVARLAARVAPTTYNVLLQGETGTGKSRLANIIHTLSPRREGPFVTIQLSTVPIHLADSLLFGHLKGAFTSADRTRTGLVETAGGGTIFLDDIEACDPAVQAKLLRLVEDKSFIPVGGSVEKRHDVRFLVASNRDLKKAVEAKQFREDLYYRLADVTISMPSLREMPEAILPLAHKFLRETCDELGRNPPLLDDDAGLALTAMPWPGNIRQLKSFIRRAVLDSDTVITGADITGTDVAVSAPQQTLRTDTQSSPPPFPCCMDALEKWLFEQALRFCDGKRMKTAMMLKMNYYTFRRKLTKHGLLAGEE
ncbi:MAG: sigma-54 dependent transcriptional regulator [Deltaproteobacteria bacterium]